MCGAAILHLLQARATPPAGSRGSSFQVGDPYHEALWSAHLIRHGELLPTRFRVRSFTRASLLACIRSSLLAAAHGSQQYPRDSAQKGKVAEHLDDEHDPGGLGFGGDVAETYGGKDGHGEVQGVGFGQRL